MEKNQIKYITKNKNENYSKSMVDSWKNNDTKEDINPIKNNYSFMTYSMWLNYKNYDEKCSYNNIINPIKDNKKEKKLSTNIEYNTKQKKINVNKLKLYIFKIHKNILLYFKSIKLKNIYY